MPRIDQPFPSMNRRFFPELKFKCRRTQKTALACGVCFAHTRELLLAEAMKSNCRPKVISTRLIRLQVPIVHVAFDAIQLRAYRATPCFKSAPMPYHLSLTILDDAPKNRESVAFIQLQVVLGMIR